MSKTLFCAVFLALMGVSMAAPAAWSELQLSDTVLKAVMDYTNKQVAASNERGMQAQPKATVSPAKGNYGHNGNEVCKKKALWSIRIELDEDLTEQICPNDAKKPADPQAAKDLCHQFSDRFLELAGQFLQTNGCPDATGKGKCTGIKCDKNDGNATTTVILKFTHVCDDCVDALNEVLANAGNEVCNIRPGLCAANGIFSATIVKATHLDAEDGLERAAMTASHMDNAQPSRVSRQARAGRQ